MILFSICNFFELPNDLSPLRNSQHAIDIILDSQLPNLLGHIMYPKK